jgi:transcription elongation factor GreA-like protein
MPEWEPDQTIEPPPWLVEGARVSHSTFGLGVVGRVGTYKDVPTVWIDFDGGMTKALALEFGLPHLTPSASEKEKRRFFARKHQRRG